MKKPKPVKKPAAKTPKAKPWAPVPVGVQRKQHQIAVRHWKPVPVGVQRKRHQAAVKAKHTRAKSKVRKLSPGYDVACCSAQAVGTLLGLSDADVLALYRLTAEGPDDGASIEATLEAGGEFFNRRGFGEQRLHLSASPLEVSEHCFDLIARPHALILGLALPEGPHAVLATADGWWSWGDLYDPGQFPGAVIDEAWAVTL